MKRFTALVEVLFVLAVSVATDHTNITTSTPTSAEVPFCSVSGFVRYRPGSGDLRYWRIVSRQLSMAFTSHVRTRPRHPAYGQRVPRPRSVPG